MADEGLSSKRKHEGFAPAASAGLSLGRPPAVGCRAPLPYSNAPPPPDEIQFASVRALSTAAKRPRVDSPDGLCEGLLRGGSLGFSSSAGGGGGALGFSSSAGGSSSLGFSSSAGGGGGLGFSSSTSGGSSSLGFSSSAGGGGGGLGFSSSGGGGLGCSSSSIGGAQIQVTTQVYAMSQLSSASGMSGDVTENRNALGPTTSLNMKIPNSKRALVIGRGHGTLNWLQSRSGASIKLIHSDCAPGVASSETTVYISGKTENVIKAKELLDDLISKGFYHAPLNWGYPGRPPKRELGHAFKLPGAYPGVPLQPYGTCAPTSAYCGSQRQWLSNQSSGPYPLQNGGHQAPGQASYSGTRPQRQQHSGHYQQSYMGGQPSSASLNNTGEQVIRPQATGFGGGPPPISVIFPQQPTEVHRPQQVANGVPPPMPFRVAQPPQQVAYAVTPPMPWVAQPPPGCAQGGQPYGSGGYG